MIRLSSMWMTRRYWARLGTSHLEQRLDRAAVRHRVEEVREVVHPLDDGDGLPVALVLGGLLDAGVDVADDRLEVEDDLALERDEQAQHPVRGGVVRPDVDGEQLVLAAVRRLDALEPRFHRDGVLHLAVLVRRSHGYVHPRVRVGVDADGVVVAGRGVCGEQDRLAADREVAALRVALVVLGHEDAAQVGVAVEDHAEHVVDLALLVVRGRPVGGDRGDGGGVGRDAQLHRHAVDGPHVEQLVVHAEARLLGVVVDPVDAHERAEALGLQLLEDPADLARRDDDLALAVSVRGVEHGVGVGVPQLPGEQLKTGCVRHLRPLARTRGARAPPASRPMDR